MSETGDELQALFDDASGDVAVGDLPAAVEKYRRCTELDPDNFEAWHALGMALSKTGDLKKAIGAAMMATTLQPNDQLAWTALSQMYMSDGQIPEAEAAKQNATVLGIGGRIDRSS